MAVKHMRVCLLVFRRCNHPVSSPALTALCEGGPAPEPNQEGTSVAVELGSYRDADFPGKDEATLTAARGARRAVFTRAADWLEGRPPALFDSVRETGAEVALWIFMEISQDQGEFKADARFLAAAGARGLSLDMITND